MVYHFQELGQRLKTLSFKKSLDRPEEAQVIPDFYGANWYVLLFSKFRSLFLTLYLDAERCLQVIQEFLLQEKTSLSLSRFEAGYW